MQKPNLSAGSLELELSEFSGISSGELTEMVNGLDYSDSILIATEMESFLERFTHTKLNSISRFGAMEILRPAVLNIIEGLTAIYDKSTIPLSLEEKNCARNVSKLIEYTSRGYELVVIEAYDEMVATDNEENSKLSIKLGVQRAILTLGLLLLETYRLYLPEPVYIWSDLHGLFKLAEELGIDKDHIKKDAGDPDLGLSIKQAYMKTVLLALFNPYHLGIGEAANIYERSGRWANFIKMEPIEDRFKAKEHFVVDLDSNYGPYYLFKAMGDEKTPDNGQVIDIISLVNILEKQIESLNSNINKVGEKSLSIEKEQRDMYIRLKKALYPRRERTTPRIPVSEKISVVEGFNACHYYISGEKQFDDNLVINNTELTGKDLEDEKIDEAVIWNQVNESEEGLALSCDRVSEMQLANGELVAMNMEEANRWSIGAIRWLKNKDDGTSEFGVQIMSSSARAIAVKNTKGEDQTAKRGVLIPDVDPFKEAATIIVPSRFIDAGMVVAIKTDSRLINVKIMELVEATGYYERYSLVALHEVS